MWFSSGVGAQTKPLRPLNEAEFPRKLVNLEAQAQAVARSPMRLQLSTSADPNERIADGDFYYQLREYERAAIILHDMVSRHPQHPGYADALVKLGDALYQVGDIEGARARYHEALDRARERSFRPYVAHAMAKLLDIATRTGEFSDVDRYLKQLNVVSKSESGTDFSNPLKYYQGKYLYLSGSPAPEVVDDDEHALEKFKVNKELLQQAQGYFQSVGKETAYYPLAQYYSGVALVMQKRYDEAIEVFKKMATDKAMMTKYPALKDMVSLALGRLYYETDQTVFAEQTYLKVGSKSKYYSTAQYELAWSYLRLGNSQKAERALDIAARNEPRGTHVPDIGVLRGNLLLREGRHKDARKAFENVKAEFGPVANELNLVVESHPSTEAYFESLVSNNLEAFDSEAFLPPLARRWTQRSLLVDKAMGTVANFENAKRMGDETDKLVARIQQAVEAENPSTVFEDARKRRLFVAINKNKLAILRYHMMHNEAGTQGAANAEIAALQSEREALDPAIARLPDSEAAFSSRDASANLEYSDRAKMVEKLDLDIVGIEAQIAALSRYVADDRRMQALPSEVVDKVRNGLTEERSLVLQYKTNLESVKQLLETLKLHVGIGDDRSKFDEERRREWIRWGEKEHAARVALAHLKSQQQEPLFERIRRAEAMLDKDDEHTAAVVAERVREIKRVLDEEMGNLSRQREGLLALKETTEKLVGSVAHENFRRVRHRFNEVVLKAEVGVMDVAWAEREEHRVRVDTLSRERAREVQAMDEEFKEIMGDTPPAKAKDESK